MTQNIDRSMNNDQKIRGCGTIALLAFLSLWVIVISLIDMFSNWALEQNIFESATSVSDIRWLDHGVCALLLFVSLLIAFLLVKTPRLKLALRLWTIAAGVAVLMTPIKRFFITDQQQTAAVQLLILLFCSLGLFIFQSIKKQSRTNGIGKSGMIGITALVAAGMFIPWLLWGALGSIDDTVIYVMLG